MISDKFIFETRVREKREASITREVRQGYEGRDEEKRTKYTGHGRPNPKNVQR